MNTNFKAFKEEEDELSHSMVLFRHPHIKLRDS